MAAHSSPPRPQGAFPLPAPTRAPEHQGLETSQRGNGSASCVTRLEHASCAHEAYVITRRWKRVVHVTRLGHAREAYHIDTTNVPLRWEAHARTIIKRLGHAARQRACEFNGSAVFTAAHS